MFSPLRFECENTAMNVSTSETVGRLIGRFIAFRDHGVHKLGRRACSLAIDTPPPPPGRVDKAHYRARRGRVDGGRAIKAKSNVEKGNTVTCFRGYGNYIRLAYFRSGLGLNNVGSAAAVCLNNRTDRRRVGEVYARCGGSRAHRRFKDPGFPVLALPN